MANTLPKFSQENVLTLLCFDDVNFNIARNALTIDLFDFPYREIAEKAIAYIDQYHVPPKDHIADEIEYLLADEKQGEQYREILKAILKLNENINTQYVIDGLLGFIKSQRFEKALYDAAELQIKGKIEEAEKVINAYQNFTISIFDAGIRLTDLALLAKTVEEDDIFPTSIHALDEAKVCPARKQLHVFMAPKSKGKSWHSIQVARTNMLLNHKVAHITLEISKEITLQRYVQNFLSLTRWQMGMVKSPFFVRNDTGSVIRVDQKMVLERPSLEDDDLIDRVMEGWNKFGPRIQENLVIKEFPTGQLTIPNLKAYLDTLERTQGFIPDILIVDQPSNMKVNRSNKDDFRIALGGLFIDLRGMGVERNIAVIVNHHINRAGAMAKFTTGEHVSEDASILNTADTGIVYNQRPPEKKYKLARLWVDRGRSVKSGFMVLIAQNYDLGQFCLDSDIVPSSYDPDAGSSEDLFNGTPDHEPQGDLDIVPDESD